MKRLLVVLFRNDRAGVREALAHPSVVPHYASA